MTTALDLRLQYRQTYDINLVGYSEWCWQGMCGGNRTGHGRKAMPHCPVRWGCACECHA